MFSLLLGVTLLTSLIICAVTVALFWGPLRGVLKDRISDSAAKLWSRGLAFAVFVVGVSFGVSIPAIETYSSRGTIEVNAITLEVYKTVVGTGVANAVLLVVVFLGIGLLAAMKKGRIEGRS